MNKAIKRVLQTHWMGQNIYYYKETDSTNIQAKSCENAGHGALFVADKQTAGRGRLGRSWESPAADNIYMTLRLEPEMEPDRAPMLTLVMALSVAEALNHVTGLEANIRIFQRRFEGRQRRSIQSLGDVSNAQRLLQRF